MERKPQRGRHKPRSSDATDPKEVGRYPKTLVEEIVPVSLFAVTLILFGVVYGSDAMKSTMTKDMNRQQTAIVTTPDGKPAPVFKTSEDAKASRRTNK